MKSKKLILFLITALLVLSSINGVFGFMEAEDLHRIGGSNRFQTASEVSKSHWDTATHVVIARSDDYADALAATSLSAELNAPLLLTATNQLNRDTAKEIQRLQPENAIVLGGENVISDKIIQELEEMGLKTERIYGENRYETGVEIATYLANIQGVEKIEEAFLVLGTDFPDALSIAPVAARNGVPIFLSDGSTIHPAVETFMDTYGTEKITAIGGENTISPNIVEDRGYNRISGANRYLTALEVAKTFETENKEVLVSTGLNFPDALSAGVLGALTDQNIILVNNRALSTELRDYLSNRSLMVIGGNNVVPTELFVEPEPFKEEEPEPPKEEVVGEKNTTLTPEDVKRLKDYSYQFTVEGLPPRLVTKIGSSAGIGVADMTVKNKHLFQYEFILSDQTAYTHPSGPFAIRGVAIKYESGQRYEADAEFYISKTLSWDTGESVVRSPIPTVIMSSWRKVQ